jgi:hypothetical protein
MANVAQAQDSVPQMREELKKLQQRIDEMDGRVKDAEAAATQAAAQASNRPQSESALNPAVSVILNGVYGHLQRDPNTYRINGFTPTLGDVAPGVRGLSLGESELAFAANIDHLFRGTLIASLSPEDTIGVEEAYIQTLGLSKGFTVKAGRFFSAIGYQNQVHAHAWDFTDAPLVMKAFLGGQLNEDGIQARWIAPLPFYLDLGVEAGRGKSFPAAPAGGPNKNGFGSTNWFTHAGGDIGESLAWQLGLSHFRTNPRERTFDDVASAGNAVTNSFSGTSRLWAVDGVLKWAPDGNPSYKNVKLQGEYFHRKEDGSLTFDTAGAALSDRLSSRQSGWYAQGVYQFLPQWRAGYRFDQLSSGTMSNGLVDSGTLTAADFPILAGYKPKKHSVMVDWNPSEFSRIRLQLARDYSRMGEPDNQMFLQYIVSLGAHGAHKF